MLVIKGGMPNVNLSNQAIIYAWRFQVFAVSSSNKALAMKRQQEKRNRLIYKLLPKVIVQKLKGGLDCTETFESASVYFCSVVGFKTIAKECTAMQVVIQSPYNPTRFLRETTFLTVNLRNERKFIMFLLGHVSQVIQFLNSVYRIFDTHIDEFDVHKVESISDSYMVSSGIPVPIEDRHATEIAKLALKLRAACDYLSRPDDRRSNVVIQAGIHSGKNRVLPLNKFQIKEKGSEQMEKKPGEI